jgi:hypothetical protein
MIAEKMQTELDTEKSEPRKERWKGMNGILEGKEEREGRVDREGGRKRGERK